MDSPSEQLAVLLVLATILVSITMGACLKINSWLGETGSTSLRRAQTSLPTDWPTLVKESYKLGKVREGESHRDHPHNKTRLEWGYLQQVHAAKEALTICDYGISSCTLLGKFTHLKKCLHTNVHSMGKKQEELEAYVLSLSFVLTAITKTWWDSSRDQNNVINSYMLSSKGRPGV